MNYISAEEAVATIKSGERVFIHGGCATPQRLVSALTNRHTELTGVEITHLHTEGEATYAQPAYAKAFRVNAFFVGKNVRPYINDTNVQYIPMFLSEIPLFMRSGRFKIDTAVIQVSPPDLHGFCSLGISVDIAKAACEMASKIIALINPNMPRSLGDSFIHQSRITSAVYATDPVLECTIPTLSNIEIAIGKNVAALVEDGATLQMGIGGIPNAVLQFLTNHKNLGVHTEMFSDGILPLVKSGVINGKLKTKHPGKIVSAFAMGTQALYNFIHDNQEVAMLDVAYVNDTSVIRKNKKVTAINSAIEIDLTGQVCADSIGTTIYSGVGGQMDFMRGAALSEGGKPILAMASATEKGISKIVPVLKTGAGVVTTRAHVHYVVTEYGAVDLYGLNIAQRAKMLISIAHPDHRESLEREAHELYGKSWNEI
ncbi:MAG TPA: acetyl-CoA hydrolase/transferase C-terminal domain-containing protein [Chitinophagales bacterium]|nr:acetyl-CoA hydrolase/transferase C-terminal domain-containing protein [Chitinophagales bacterium]